MTIEWQPIETFPGNTPFEEDGGTKYYADVMLFGPTLCPWSSPKPEDFAGEPAEICIGRTHDGAGLFYIAHSGCSDGDSYCLPTHWAPMPQPPEATHG